MMDPALADKYVGLTEFRALCWRTLAQHPYLHYAERAPVDLHEVSLYCNVFDCPLEACMGMRLPETVLTGWGTLLRDTPHFGFCAQHASALYYYVLLRAWATSTAITRVLKEVSG